MRKYFVLVILSILLLFQITNNTYAQWTTNYLHGYGSITALAVSGTNILAGTYNHGAFLSTNNGKTWTAVDSGLSNTWITGFAVSGDNIFALTHGSLFLSTNNGTNWSAVDLGSYNKLVRIIYIRDTDIFAGTDSAGIYLSQNNGKSWTSINAGIPDSMSIIALMAIGDTIISSALGCTKGPKFYENWGEILQSTDKGENWTVVLPKSIVNSFARRNGYLFAAGDAGIFRSTDNGTNWIKVNSLIVTNLMVNGNSIHALSHGNIYQSTDNGENWNKVDSGHSVSSLAADSINIFAGTDSSNFLLSNNNGTTWNTTGSVTPSPFYLTVNGRNIFITTYNAGNSGIFRSTDTCVSWSLADSGIRGHGTDNLLVSDNNVFATTDSGIFISTNYGISWTAACSGLPSSYSVLSIAVSGNNIFAGTAGSGIYRSLINGTSWAEVNSGLTTTWVTSFAMIGNNLFAATDGLDGGIFLTTNNGTNWTEVSSGLTNTNVGCLVASGNNLFAGTEFSHVFISTNNGTNWTNVSSGLPSNNGEIMSLAVKDNNIFSCINSHGIYLSTNNGENWAAANTGFPRNGVGLTFQSIIIGDGMVFTFQLNGSVWHRPLSELIGTSNEKQRRDKPKLIDCKIHVLDHSYTNVAIKFSIPHSDYTIIKIYDISGREIVTLLDKYVKSGPYVLLWNKQNIAKGCYFLKMQVGANSLVKSIPVSR